jgi:hypothetical protein
MLTVGEQKKEGIILKEIINMMNQALESGNKEKLEKTIKNAIEDLSELRDLLLNKANIAKDGSGELVYRKHGYED